MKTKAIVIIGSLAVGLLIVTGAYVMAGAREPAAPVESEVPLRPVSQAELAAADGMDGRPCLVAVDGTVYEIADFMLWQDGEHVPSEGQAYCGADMSEVIRQAPHGTSKLELLTEVGPLQD